MTDIDWSKAPEGATHKHPFGWYKRVDDKWFFTPLGMSDWKQSIHQWTDSEFLAVRPTEQPAWNGEGNPPIGTEVEYKAGIYEAWEKGKILAYHDKFVWVLEGHDNEPCTYALSELEFRPIKSDRDQQIDALLSVIQTLPNLDFRDDFAEALYDKGVRVQL
jgi:hypothetical protein